MTVPSTGPVPTRRAAVRARSSNARPICALLLALLLPGCDQLGNPPLGGVTKPTRWSDGLNVTVTQTLSVPPEAAELVLRRIPGGRAHHLDKEAPRDGVVTLVEVQPQWGQQRLPLVIPLVTELELVDGRTVRRRWEVPANAGTWYGAFALPALPKRAVTELLL